MAEKEDQVRPCHGCHNDFHDCTCKRRRGLVIRKPQCPHCTTEFRTAITGKRTWPQRCGECLRTFDAVDESFAEVAVNA